MCDFNLSNERLAEKFKREFNDQFHILVRMHLSFVLDLNTDENECLPDKGKVKKWSLAPFNKKHGKSRGVMEGAPLTQEGICQVYQLIEFLKKEQNIKVEGIFRRTGSLNRQQELRNLLNQGLTLQLEAGDYSIHDCASVLKGFLAELPDPLLTEAHYPAYCQIAELCGVTAIDDVDKPAQEEKLLTALQLILLLLPSENKVLLKDILDLLNLTASYESSNRMSADNLAKLFTPHLLCPRKLTPEQLHVTSQSLLGIVAFMINHSLELFKIPQKLIVDFRARYEKQKLLNESMSDAASTVFTFVDQERTAKENESNTTETALAQLYAHIQSMPESSKKRKLVKQFNKENGNGTPLQVVRSGMQHKNKSIGDSIKKHIFHKGLARKKAAGIKVPSAEGAPETPNKRHLGTPLASRARLFCTNSGDSSNDDQSNYETEAKKQKKSPELLTTVTDDDKVTTTPTSYITSTPACRVLHEVVFTPEGHGRKSMSPITRSTQRMTKAMQETMMTPRSRKPVLLVSGTNINALAKLETVGGSMANLPEELNSELNEEPPCKQSRQDSLTDTFREYLHSRSILTTSSPAVEDSSFSSRTDDFNSNDFNDVSESKMTESLLICLDGEVPNEDEGGAAVQNEDDDGEKKLVLKPKQFDENGQPIVFETSF